MCDQDRRRLPEVERLALDARLGKRDAEKRLVRWLERVAPGDSGTSTAWLALCALRLREQRFDDARVACTAAERGEPGSATSVLGLLEALRTLPPPSWNTDGLVVELRDRRVQVAYEGESVEALVDTGAEFAVTTAAAARRLGGRPLRGSVVLSTTTAPVAGDLVLLPVLRIGEAELRGIIAIVLPDSQLAYAEEDFVLGLPAVLGLGRMAFLDHGRRLALGAAVPVVRGPEVPLYWDESGVGFAVDFPRGRRGVHLDTGARRTTLFPAAVPALAPEQAAARVPVRRVVGGLGGERVEHGFRLPPVTLSIAGSRWERAGLEMAETDENGEAARMGYDMIEHFEEVLLDFTRMRLSLVEAVRR